MGKVTKNRIASLRAAAEFEGATIAGSSVVLPESGGGGAITEVYAAAAQLPLVGNTTGDQAYVTGNTTNYYSRHNISSTLINKEY